MLFFCWYFDCRKIGTHSILDNAATNFDRTTHQGAVTVSGDTDCYSNKIEWKTAGIRNDWPRIEMNEIVCDVLCHLLYKIKIFVWGFSQYIWYFIV